jgi:hypothetical protein
MAGRAAGFAVWTAVTVVVPLVFFEATHRWEEDQDVGTALRWTVAAVPVLAAAVAARWTGRTGRRRSVRARLAATAAGTLTGSVSLAGSMAFYRWVIPLSEDPDRRAWWLNSWPGLWWSGLLLSAAGAVIGCAVGLRRDPRSPRSPRNSYLAGALVAVAGALLAPTVVRLGAEDSTVRYDEGRYGSVGPGAGPAVLELPAAGRYAIMAVGFAPDDPDCLVSGPGPVSRRAEPVAIPPGDYGGDAASYAWVASFTVPGPGTYALTCRTGDEQAQYTVGDVPQIRGAVGAMIHWPVAVTALLGSIPGLLIVAGTYRRRAKPAEAPVP